MAAEQTTQAPIRRALAAELARASSERCRIATEAVGAAHSQRIQALALRGWARSLRRRDRRARFEAAMLREQAQSLCGPTPTDTRLAGRAATGQTAGPA